MSNILDQLNARRHHTTVLRSGLKVGFHYPDAEECILKVGQLPLAALNGVKAEPTEEEAMKIVSEQPDAIAKGMAFTRLMVATMLDDIDGEPIESDDDRSAIVAALEPEERQELFLIATRQRDPDAPKVEPAEV